VNGASLDGAKGRDTKLAGGLQPNPCEFRYEYHIFPVKNKGNCRRDEFSNRSRGCFGDK